MRALLVVAWLATFASASEVQLIPGKLDELCRRAELVIVAERVGPPDDRRFRIVETLRWSGAAADAPSGTLRVFDADQELNEAIGKHIAEHGYEGVPSVIRPRYQSSLDQKHFARARRVILFLRRWKSDWQLAMYDAWEAVGKRPAVAEALAKAAPP